MTQEAINILKQKMIDAGIPPVIRSVSEDSACIEIPMYENTAISGTSLVFSPFDKTLPIGQRVNNIIMASQVVMNITTYILHKSYSLPCCQNASERLQVANSILQRAASYHASNLKLTKEGITVNLGDSVIEVPDAYKTIPLTRSVYEHLAMFFYLFERPCSAEERDVVWKLWKIDGYRNQVSHNGDYDSDFSGLQKIAEEKISQLTEDILTTSIGIKYAHQLKEYLKHGNNGSVKFSRDKHGKPVLERLSYAGAWKDLHSDFAAEINFTSRYRLLSMHCHPTYVGLSHFMNQADDEDPFTGMALHCSSSFLARLCYYYIQQLPEGTFNMEELFTPYALGILDAYSNSL